MTKSIGSQLPPVLAGVLDGTDLAAHEGLLLLLMTADGDGLIHVAMLSVGEVVATDPGHLRLGLWPRSTTTAHLAEQPRALLYVIADGAGYAMDIQARSIGAVREEGVHVAVYEAAITDVREDRVSYAELTAAPTFRLVDRERELERWARTVDLIRTLDGGRD